MYFDQTPIKVPHQSWLTAIGVVRQSVNDSPVAYVLDMSASGADWTYALDSAGLTLHSKRVCRAADRFIEQEHARRFVGAAQGA